MELFPEMPPSFLIITPLGLACRELEALFAESGIIPQQRVGLKDWGQVSNHLRGVLLPARAEAFLRVWQSHFPEDQAEIWFLDKGAYTQALFQKNQLRSQLPQLSFCLLSATSQGVHHLFPFHLPEPEELELHYQRLAAFQAESGIKFN